MSQWIRSEILTQIRNKYKTKPCLLCGIEHNYRSDFCVHCNGSGRKRDSHGRFVNET